MNETRADPMDTLIERIRLFSSDLSMELVKQISHQLERTATGDWYAIRQTLFSAVASSRFRIRVVELIEAWQQITPTLAPTSVALALRTVASEREASRREQITEMVWTGPASSAPPFRRTDQALLQVIERASAELLVVAFAVYRVPLVAAALYDALMRGVRVRLVIETVDDGDGKVTFDGTKALRRDVLERAEIYVWPRVQRPADGQGRHGSLHVKCALADSEELLVSSANLTAYALILNMELGVLVRGGSLPQQVHNHFDRLIQNGILVRINQ